MIYRSLDKVDSLAFVVIALGTSFISVSKRTFSNSKVYSGLLFNGGLHLSSLSLAHADDTNIRNTFVNSCVLEISRCDQNKQTNKPINVSFHYLFV